MKRVRNVRKKVFFTRVLCPTSDNIVRSGKKSKKEKEKLVRGPHTSIKVFGQPSTVVYKYNGVL